jgi:hypothetical protein
VFDVRQIAHLSIVYNTPYVGSGWKRQLLGQWKVSPLLTLQTGNYFSPTTGADNSRTGVNLDRPNIVGNRYLKDNATHTWLNPAGFQANAIGTFGNAGAYSLLGPGFFTIDAALSRFVPIFHEHNVELRFEAFNVLNHVNYGNPNSNLSSSNFGRITAAKSPRALQFAAKYSF